MSIENEVAAMRGMVEVLLPFDHPARRRMLEWLNAWVHDEDLKVLQAKGEEERRRRLAAKNPVTLP